MSDACSHYTHLITDFYYSFILVSSNLGYYATPITMGMGLKRTKKYFAIQLFFTPCPVICGVAIPKTHLSSYTRQKVNYKHVHMCVDLNTVHSCPKSLKFALGTRRHHLPKMENISPSSLCAANPEVAKVVSAEQFKIQSLIQLKI